MTIDCYSHLSQLLNHPDHQSAVLATVVQVYGSVPREVGAKMVIGADGQTFSTIGGGAGEAKVIDYAMQVLQSGEKQLVEIDLSGTPQSDMFQVETPKQQTEGICGGRMQVWLERWCGAEASALVHQILALLQSGQVVTVVTPFAPDTFPYLLDDALPAPSNAFVERIQPPPTLLIVGAGHVGEQLAKVADLIGFQIMVQDDRPEWANARRYPQAIHIFTDPIGTVIDHLSSHTQLYAALVTRGYQYDLDALKAILNRGQPCQYIGMIGSKKRVRQVYQAIEQTGISSHTLQSIYAPIGLDIGALTPEEIAISICAELILVRRGGTGRSLSKVQNSASFLEDRQGYQSRI